MIYLYALGAANGILLAILLMLSARKSGANKAMGLWCLFLSLNFLGSFVYIDKTVNIFSFLIGWTYFLPAAYGGLLYVYCKLLLNNATLRWRDTAHLLPLIFCYALNIDILFAPSEQKLQYILDLPPLTPSFYLSQFVLYAQAIVYGVMCVVMLLQYKKAYKQQFSNIEKDRSYWLAVLIALSLFIWISKLLPSVLNEAYWLSEFGAVMIVLLIYLVGFMQWFKPYLFQTEQLIDTQNKANNLTQSASESVVKPLITAKLDTQTHKALAKAIDESVIKQTLYLKEDLSLADLSQHTNISIHHLSETLNYYIKKNFYRYINDIRVEHFCRLMVLHPEKTITSLALESGFANKSTFNAAFKEIHKMTPSEYRNLSKKGTN